MVRYLVGTDGLPASEAISDYLEGKVDEDDHLAVLNVMTAGDDYDEMKAGEEALQVFTDRFGETVSITTKQQSHRGRGPVEEFREYADEIDADEYVMALRRHTRTERVILGSVSHKLLQHTVRPVTLVPLKQYLPSVE